MTLEKFQQQVKKIPTSEQKFLLDKLDAYNILKKAENASSDYPDVMLKAIDRTDAALNQFIHTAILALDKKLPLSGIKNALTGVDKNLEKTLSSRRGKYYQSVAQVYESELTTAQRAEFKKAMLENKPKSSAFLVKLSQNGKSK